MLYAGPGKPDLSLVAADQPPINKMILDEENTVLIDVNEPSRPCSIEGAAEIPGSLIVWDDGGLADLQVRRPVLGALVRRLLCTRAASGRQAACA